VFVIEQVLDDDVDRRHGQLDVGFEEHDVDDAPSAVLDDDDSPDFSFPGARSAAVPAVVTPTCRAT
jgi:hypothetical protein